MFKRMMVLSAIASALVFAGCRDQNREAGGRYGEQPEQMQGTGGAGQDTVDDSAAGGGTGSSGSQDMENQRDTGKSGDVGNKGGNR
jgi:hypothetical protein